MLLIIKADGHKHKRHYLFPAEKLKLEVLAN
jgi:hypothetical protein